MRTRIVRRFLWSAFVLLAISLLGVDLYVTRLTSSNETEDLRAALTAQARLLAGQFPANSEHYAAWMKSDAGHSGARVTLLDRDGAALADSEPAGAPTGSNDEQLSVEVPLQTAPFATLRLSRSLEPIHSRASALQLRLLTISLISLALAAGLAFIFVQSFSRQSSRAERMQITSSTTQLNDGLRFDYVSTSTAFRKQEAEQFLQRIRIRGVP
jgi:hypothetical protein